MVCLNAEAKRTDPIDELFEFECFLAFDPSGFSGEIHLATDDVL